MSLPADAVDAVSGHNSSSSPEWKIPSTTELTVASITLTIAILCLFVLLVQLKDCLRSIRRHTPGSRNVLIMILFIFALIFSLDKIYLTLTLRPVTHAIH